MTKTETKYAIKTEFGYLRDSSHKDVTNDKKTHFYNILNDYTSLFNSEENAKHFIETWAEWFKDLKYEIVKVKKETVITYREEIPKKPVILSGEPPIPEGTVDIVAYINTNKHSCYEGEEYCNSFPPSDKELVRHFWESPDWYFCYAVNNKGDIIGDNQEDE